MISRRAQLKDQDEKVSSLTDDFTMRNFIAVRPRASGTVSFQSTGFLTPSLFLRIRVSCKRRSMSL